MLFLPANSLVTIVMDDGKDWLDVLTVVGTMSAAVIAAVAAIFSWKAVREARRSTDTAARALQAQGLDLTRASCLAVGNLIEDVRQAALAAIEAPSLQAKTALEGGLRAEQRRLGISVAGLTGQKLDDFESDRRSLWDEKAEPGDVLSATRAAPDWVISFLEKLAAQRDQKLGYASPSNAGVGARRWWRR